MSLAVGPSRTSIYHASDGAAYEVWLGRWARRLAEIFFDFAGFPDTGDILDIGCGTGALTFAMADRWPSRRVIGLDLAEPFVEYARSRRLGELPILEIGDACALPYRDGQFVAQHASLFSCSSQDPNGPSAKCIGSYFAKLTPDLKARIKEGVRDAYCSGAPDGERSLTATAWAVRGTVP